MSFLLVKQGISQWVINSPLENHSAVPYNYGWPHKNQWRWEWKRAATLEKRKLGTLIVGESRMNNEQPDPSPWFDTFKSVRLIVFFFSLIHHHLLSTFARGEQPLEVSRFNVVQLYQDIVVQGCRHREPLFPDRAECGNTEQLASILAEL